MSYSENLVLKPFVDYIPAELRANKKWLIVYYVIDPITQKLTRKQNRVRPLKSLTERKKLAKRMILEINTRLQKGWNPFLEKPKVKNLTLLSVFAKTYINQLEKDYKDEVIRVDTLRTYKSRLKVFQEYLEANNKSDLIGINLSEDIITDFLDYLRHEKNLSARTRDNYFTALQTFTLWSLKKKYLNYCPCESISKINKKKTEKIVIPADIRLIIFNYYESTNPQFLLMCMVCYYCLVRRTEISKIRIHDISIKNQTLYIPGNSAKNRKDAHVTIPKHLIALLVPHIKNANPTDLLFSENNYLPGPKHFLPNRLTSNWTRMRNKLKIDKKYKWYDLKSSGITDLIISGVPLLSVRDQARHYSIKQTDEYTPRNMKKADSNILNSGVNFN